jgi:hypothetical protein
MRPVRYQCKLKGGGSPHCSVVPSALKRCCVQRRSSSTRGAAHASLVTSVAETAILAAAFGGLASSALPLLTGKVAEQNADRTVTADTSEDDFVFGVMSAISFLPYVNWTVGPMGPASRLHLQGTA